MPTPLLTEAQLWQLLEQVKDPEMPVVSVVEMGIVRQIAIADDQVTVQITPTFAGCPALGVMRQEIGDCIRQAGFAQVEVETVLHPPWSTDWISETARQKLQAFGIAPPVRHGGNVMAVAFLDTAVCPRCGSSQTTLKNSFGPTLCKMIWYCDQCQDAFEQFKVL